MENTSDPIIRPSENTRLQAEMSYLFGRDPSILAYGQRPCLTNESQKNLISLYENEDADSRFGHSSSSSITELPQTVKVYLRMKPFPKKMKLLPEHEDAYRIINSTTLMTKLPNIERNTSSFKRLKCDDTVCRKFMFTQTFGPETTQLQLFEQAIKQQMISFLAGQNSTVLSYGTTSAGKSYTLQGTTASPGIIPRSLEFVFSNINPRLTPCYKPIYDCGVVPLDPNERAKELEKKSKLLTFGSIDKNQYINAYKQMQKLLQEESPLKPSENNDAHYSVWVSFAEIYNETIYDLLSNDCQKRRMPLKLATDSHGRAFIKGLKTICVNSGSEAYQVLMAGQYNLKVAATALNAKSSRSHCIFTIKLLRYYAENVPDEVEVSTFSFCDLAGSERLKKTLNVGDRLKEAQNINTSLLVLGRCLKSIYDGQSIKQKQEVAGPFRESKLTRLFQRALSGKEYISMIVNVNPAPNLYIETQNVLNFSAIAKKIIVEPKEMKRITSTSRFSKVVTHSMKTITDWENTLDLESVTEEKSSPEVETTTYIHREDYEDLVKENEELRSENAALKRSALERDLQIRQEMADTYTALMKDLEANWKSRIKDVEEEQENMRAWSVAQVEQFYKQKLNQMSNRKRRRSSCINDTEDDEYNIEELESENTRLTEKVESLKKIIKDLRESREVVNIEKNKVCFELSVVKEDLKTTKSLLEATVKDNNYDEESMYYIKELKSQLSLKQDRINTLKKFLDEAKLEYIVITTDAREMEERLQQQDEIIAENSEKIMDLEENLEQANVCLAEKTKTIERLEEKLERQTKNLMDSEDVMKHTIKINSGDGDKCDEEFVKIEVIPDSDTENSSMDEIEKVQKGPLQNISDAKKSSEIVTLEETLQEDGNLVLQQMEAKLSEVQVENVTLKEKLTRSGLKIKLLNEEVEQMKTQMDEISKEINDLKVTNIKVETRDGECQVISTDCVDQIEKESQTCSSLSGIKSSKDNYTNSSTQTTENEERETYLQHIKELTQELKDVKERKEEQEKIIHTLELQYNEWRSKVELLEKESKSINEEKKNLEKELTEMKDIKGNFEMKADDFETENGKLLKKLLEVTNKCEQLSKSTSKYTEENATLQSQLSTTKNQLSDAVSKCLKEHEPKIGELQTQVSAAEERDNIKAQCIDVYALKISKLEQELDHVNKRLKEIIVESKGTVERYEEENANLQRQLGESNDKIKFHKTQLEEILLKEQEKETEIINLQKEIKNMMQSKIAEPDDRMEKLMKSTNRELIAMKEALAHSEELYNSLQKTSKQEIENLQMRLETFEQNASYLKLLQDAAERKQAEGAELQNRFIELQKRLNDKTLEMESFIKNRDETIARYENYVKTLNEEVDRNKREVKRFQELFARQTTPTPSKEDIKKLKEDLRTKNSIIEQYEEKIRKIEDSRKNVVENTSDEDVAINEVRRTRRRGRARQALSPSTTADEIVVMDPSDSESKKTSRRAAHLRPPEAESTSEKKRTGRKKRLFTHTDETCIDVESSESARRPPSPSPSTSTRSLRNRRK